MTTTAAPEATDKAIASALDSYNAARDQVKQSNVERDVEVDLIFACQIARVHPILIGPPGTAKSKVVDDVLSHVSDDILTFSRLLAKDTPSEEVLGPPNLAALEHGSWERVITGKLPLAYVAFLDEIFKANSTVLNALLKIINERIFFNNGDAIRVPLWMLVGASNELPGHDRDDLRAFRDRFGICKMVEPVRTDDGVRTVLDGQLDRYMTDVTAADDFATYTKADVETLQQAVANVSVPASVKDDMVNLHRRAEAENLPVSLRRIFEGLRVAMAKAVLRGSDTLASDDLAVFEHVLWTDPEDHGTAYNLTLEYAGVVAKKAAKFRTEFEPIVQELNELKPKIPADGNIDQELAGSFARVNMLLKNLNGRVEKAITDAGEDKRDPTALNELKSAIATQRTYVRDEVLGFGM